MTRRRRLLATALVGLVGATSWGAGGMPGMAGARPGPAKTYPANLLVYAQEWSLWPSRSKLPAGTVDVQLWNRGQDAHDLRIRRRNAAGAMTGPVIGAVPVTPSGAVHKAVWHLRAGRYEIYCSLPGHLMMGMHANLTVTG